MRTLLSVTWAILIVLALVGCEDRNRVEPMSPEEVEGALEGAPSVFVGDGERVSLEGLESVYLGQPGEEAISALEERCGRLVELEGGWLRDYTYFKGCKMPDHPFVRSIRVGFHPEAKDRVFTLEVKRDPVSLDVIRARFVQRFGELVEDIPRRGALQMGTRRYNLFASWDEGMSGPVHIVFGLTPAEVDGLSAD